MYSTQPSRKMQSWADIASDSDEDEHHPANKVQQEPVVVEPESEEESEEPPPPEREYNWPAEPPFTAYVGNLAFSVKDSEEMRQGVTDLLHQRFQTQISIVSSRLAIDRHENKPRGFGYLEVETVDDLKTLLKLNDGQSMMKGRPLKLDVAQLPSNTSVRRGNSGGPSLLHRPKSESSGQVDGNSFRGGRFSRQGSNNSAVLQRQSSVQSESSESKQRPSLKLAPRSKPRDLGKESSASSLFGEGKKRDESEWERGRESRGSGRGGSGTGGGRGTKGRGEGNKARGDKQQSGRGGSFRGKQQGAKEEPKKLQPNKENPKKPQPAPQRETDAPKPALLAPPEPAKPATTAKLQNKFAALNMDSDSD